MGPVQAQFVLWRSPSYPQESCGWIDVGKGGQLCDGAIKYASFHVFSGENCLNANPLCKDFRHTCEQNDGMAGYGWEEYDIRKGGRQTVHDAGNSIDMTIDFVKVPGGLHGGSWAARVKGTPRESAPTNLLTTVVFYTSLDGLGSIEVEKGDEESVGFEGDVKLKGVTPDLGDFSIDVTSGPDTNEHPKFTHPSYQEKPLENSFVSSLEMPQEHLWQAKSKFGCFFLLVSKQSH